MTRALVTGATGFLGRHLVSTLLERGYEVTALVRTDAALPNDRVARVRGDVLDQASVEAATRDIDLLFHCAGKVSRRPEDAGELHEVHVEGTKRCLAAAKKSGVKRVVVASTSGIVAVSEEPREIDERAIAPMPIIATWPYYRSKLFAERAAFELAEPGFDVVAVNPTLLLGPGDANRSSTQDVTDFLEERVPVIPRGGISFVDARDAAIGMVLAGERGKSGERYLLAAQNLTIAAFCDRLSRISGVDSPSMRMPSLNAKASRSIATLGAKLMERIGDRIKNVSAVDTISAEMAQYFWYVDASKARRELGWEPRDPSETLVDTVRDLEARGVVWPRANVSRSA